MQARQRVTKVTWNSWWGGFSLSVLKDFITIPLTSYYQHKMAKQTRVWRFPSRISENPQRWALFWDLVECTHQSNEARGIALEALVLNFQSTRQGDDEGRAFGFAAPMVCITNDHRDAILLSRFPPKKEDERTQNRGDNLLRSAPRDGCI